MRPFRFSIGLPHTESRDELRAFARKAEELGFDVLTAPDHLIDILPPFAALACAADATTRIRLGTLVLNNDLRHPVITAREAASLQALSGGRFELGIGAGHAEPEYASIGLAFEEASSRVARLGEAVGIIKQLFAGGPVTFHGRCYHLTEHRLYPSLADPPPLFIGGNGRNLLRLAAREAHIVGFTGLGRTLKDGQRHEPTGFTAEHVAERVAVVRQAAGERFADIELNALVQMVKVTGNRATAADAIAGGSSPLTAQSVLESPFLLVGTTEEMAEDLRVRRKLFGISYYSFFAGSLEGVAPVIPLLR